MKLYAIRHGLTDMNIKGLYNGSIDEDINNIGVSQAREARENLKDFYYDTIYCSPMLRTRHTCDIINYRNKPVIYDERLVERTLGYLDGKNLAEEGFGKDKLLNYNYKFDDSSMEDVATLFKRVHAFLEEVIENNRDKNVLIVTHGCILRAIYFCFHSLPEDGDLSSVVFKNCEILCYEV